MKNKIKIILALIVVVLVLIIIGAVGISFISYYSTGYNGEPDISSNFNNELEQLIKEYSIAIKTEWTYNKFTIVINKSYSYELNELINRIYPIIKRYSSDIPRRVIIEIDDSELNYRRILVLSIDQ